MKRSLLQQPLPPPFSPSSLPPAPLPPLNSTSFQSHTSQQPKQQYCFNRINVGLYEHNGQENTERELAYLMSDIQRNPRLLRKTQTYRPFGLKYGSCSSLFSWLIGLFILCYYPIDITTGDYYSCLSSACDSSFYSLNMLSFLALLSIPIVLVSVNKYLRKSLHHFQTLNSNNNWQTALCTCHCCVPFFFSILDHVTPYLLIVSLVLVALYLMPTSLCEALFMKLCGGVVDTPEIDWSGDGAASVLLRPLHLIVKSFGVWQAIFRSLLLEEGSPSPPHPSWMLRKWRWWWMDETLVGFLALATVLYHLYVPWQAISERRIIKFLAFVVWALVGMNLTYFGPHACVFVFIVLLMVDSVYDFVDLMLKY